MRKLLFLASCASVAALAVSCTSGKPQAVVSNDAGPQEVGHGQDAPVPETSPAESGSMDGAVPVEVGFDTTDPDAMAPSDAAPDAGRAPDAEPADAAPDAPSETGGPCFPDGGCPSPFECFYPVVTKFAQCPLSFSHGFCGLPATGPACGGKERLYCGCDSKTGGVYGCGPAFAPPGAIDASYCSFSDCLFQLQPAFEYTPSGHCVYDASVD